MYFVFCKFSAPTIEYISYLSYLPLEGLKVLWRAEVLSLSISETNQEAIPKMRKYQDKC